MADNSDSNLETKKPSAGIAGDVNTDEVANTSSVAGDTLSDSLDNLAAAGGIILTHQGDLETHNGSAAIRLPVGTNGQILTVDLTTPAGIKWAAAGGSSPLTTQGDLYGFGAADARIPVGSNGQVLTADSGEALGLKWATPATYTPPVTTTGDVFIYGAASTDRLPVGTNGQVLTADTGEALGLKWATPATYTPPVTTTGDIFIYGAAAPDRLPAGASGQILIADSGQPLGLRWTGLISTKGTLMTGDGVNTALLSVGTNGQVLTADSGEVSGLKWATPATYTPPVTTTGDIFIYGAAAPDRLPVGTNGHVLTADSGEALGIKWAAGGSSPLTTQGDLYGFGAADARIPVGSNGQVLTADSGEALGLKWATPATYTPPVTTTGDIFVYGAASTARLPVGANNQIIVADSGEALGMKWVDLLTTKGDMTVGNGSGLSFLSVGTNGQVITADSGEALGLKWATPATYTPPVTTTGDIFIYGAASTTRLPVGTNDYILVPDSGESLGLKWTPNTAAKRTYDAVVAASGGDYTTVGAALTAGAKSIFIREGTYVETTELSLQDCLLQGEGWGTTTLTINQLVGAQDNAVINDLTLAGAPNGSSQPSMVNVYGNDVTFNRVRFHMTNASTPTNKNYAVHDEAQIKHGITFNDCVLKFDINDANVAGIGAVHGSSYNWKINDLLVEGGGNVTQVLDYQGTDGVFDGIFSADGTLSYSAAISIDGDNNTLSDVRRINVTVDQSDNWLSEINVHSAISLLSACLHTRISNSKLGTLTIGHPVLEVSISGCEIEAFSFTSTSPLGVYFANCYFNGSAFDFAGSVMQVTTSYFGTSGVTVTISGSRSVISSSDIPDGNLVISGDYNRAVGNMIGTPGASQTDKITLSGDYNIATSNHMDDTLSDTGTGNVTDNNIVF